MGMKNAIHGPVVHFEAEPKAQAGGVIAAVVAKMSQPDTALAAAIAAAVTPADKIGAALALAGTPGLEDVTGAQILDALRDHDPKGSRVAKGHETGDSPAVGGPQ